MNRRVIGWLCGVLMGLGLGVIPSWDAEAKGFATVPLAKKPLSLLDGRLWIRAPKGAFWQPRSYSIMSAPRPSQEETRIVVWDKGGAKLILMAYELFAKATPQLQSKANAIWNRRKPGSFTFQKGQDTKALKTTHIVPTQPTKKRPANLLRGMYVVRQDGSMQYLALYANPTAAADLAGCITLGKRVFDSLKAGRDLEMPARTATMEGLQGSGASMTLRLPAGFVQTLQKGPSFLVYRFRGLVAFGARNPSLLIYIGHHPRYSYTRRLSEKQVRRVKGTLLGAPVQWRVWNHGNLHRIELIHVIKQMHRSPKIHVMVNATSAKEAEAFRQIAETLQVQMVQATKKTSATSKSTSIAATRPVPSSRPASHPTSQPNGSGY